MNLMRDFCEQILDYDLNYVLMLLLKYYLLFFFYINIENVRFRDKYFNY